MRAARVLLSCTILAFAASDCGRNEAPPPEPAKAAAVSADRLAMFAPLPAAVPAASRAVNDEMIALGRMLYYEPRLSKSQKISCNTCHDLAKYGVDGEPTSDGHKGQKGDRNSPTVYNAAAHFAQFWDGRAADVEEQAKGPVLNPVEMAMAGEAAVVAVLKSMPEYVERSRRRFPARQGRSPTTTWPSAIGAFERKLMTPSRWDKFLDGDPDALTPEEKVGLKTFLDAGCQTCHNGALLGGTSTRSSAGEALPGNARSGPLQGHQERGRQGGLQGAVAAQRREDRRRTSTTATWRRSQEAVRQMAEYQLGQDADGRERCSSIVAFLKALTGKIDRGVHQAAGAAEEHGEDAEAGCSKDMKGMDRPDPFTVA